MSVKDGLRMSVKEGVKDGLLFLDNQSIDW